MVVVFNKGKVKIKKLGNISYHECSNCGNVEMWDLRLYTKSFTVFFVPIITYKKIRYTECPSCETYIELSKSDFKHIHKQLPNYSSNIVNDVVLKSISIIGVLFMLSMLLEYLGFFYEQL